MNKGIISEVVMAKIDYKSKEDNELIQCIEETKVEMDVARAMFDFVSDPKLIEVAIFSEEVAKRRYDYLITIAKQRGINKKINL